MKRNKLLSLTAALLLSLALFCGCGGNDTGSKAAKSDQLKIGVMQFGEFDALQNAYRGFVDGLKDAGYNDGDNIRINYLSAAADTANCPTIANTLINDDSDLILAIATPSVSAVKEKTTTIPILFTAVTDPVQSGFFKDASAPGGNISGTSDLNPVKEQIELLHQLLPNAKRVAVFYCSSESNSLAQYELAKKQLEALGLECLQKTVSSVDEIKSTIESLKGQADAIYVPTDNTLADSMTTVIAASNGVKIPVIAGEQGMVKNGALATFGIDYYELGKQTAEMAVTILKSDDPLKTIGGLPVGFQTRECRYAVNTDTAKTLGITLPESILSVADQYPAK